MTEAGNEAEALIAQVEQARAKLAAAAAGADLPGIAEALDELERTHSLARESGVAIPRPGPRTEEKRT